MVKLNYSIKELSEVYLSGQHSSIRWSFITVSLHFHTTSNTGNGFSEKLGMMSNKFQGLRMQLYLPERSVTWTKVSLKEAKMWATPKTVSPSRTCGPRVTTASSFWTFPLRGAMFHVWISESLQMNKSTLLKTDVNTRKHCGELREHTDRL